MFSKEPTAKERDRRFARFAFKSAILETFYYELLTLNTDREYSRSFGRDELMQCMFSAVRSTKPRKLPLKYTLAYSGAAAKCKSILETYFEPEFRSDDRIDLNVLKAKSLVLIATSLSELVELNNDYYKLSTDQQDLVIEARGNYYMFIDALKSICVEERNTGLTEYLNCLVGVYDGKLDFK